MEYKPTIGNVMRYLIETDEMAVDALEFAGMCESVDVLDALIELGLKETRLWQRAIEKVAQQ